MLESDKQLRVIMTLLFLEKTGTWLHRKIMMVSFVPIYFKIPTCMTKLPMAMKYGGLLSITFIFKEAFSKDMREI